MADHEPIDIDALRREFAQPPLSLRGAPFWSWNDRLQPEELARQLRDMKAHGMGGFFMHSREGLETPYMGPEWMACIRETVRAAREEGMGAWLYDEDRWPSGFAGGLVTARGDAFRAKVVILEECAGWPEDAEGLLAVFAARIEGGALRSVRRLLEGEPLQPEERVLVFRRQVSPKSEWFNDDTYADNLNPDAVAAFIETTYEAYAREVGSDFGGAVPGIFTDEPNVFAGRVRPACRALPWSDGLPAFFRERRGYDLLDALPWLFYDGASDAGRLRAAKARHDYWYTISQRFTEAYSQQLGAWCDEHDLAFTGHYLYENEMAEAILHGGAIMPHYRYQHVPGIDMLTEQNHEFLAIKQCSSVANQLGRKRVLSETYGCTGWEFTFEGQKWVGDWQYVLGVNLRCQHLALYSLRGCRKRDYPPAFNYNTTWWKYNGVVEDYFARVGSVLTAGEAVRDVLVLHPIATGWSMLREGDDSRQEVDRYGEHLNDFIRAVLATHYDCDLGDEQIMAAEARVEGDTLWVGRAPYKVVVVPPDTRTLLASTVDLLERFLAGGGRVIALAPLPEMVEAVPSDRAQALWRRPGVTVLAEITALQPALEAVLSRRVSLRDAQGQEAASLLYMQRRIGPRMAYFLVNNDRRHSHTLEVTLEGRGRLEEWDPLTGAISAVPAEEANGRLRFTATFGPAGSRLFVVDPEGQPLPAPKERPPLGGGRPFGGRGEPASFIGPVCPFTRTDPNVLTLDVCRYRLEGGEWSEAMEVWRAQREVREALGMRQVFYNGLPQRYRWALAPHPRDGAALELLFTFHVREVPANPVYLLVEGAEQFRISLNGQAVPNRVVGWYLDRSFHKVLLPALVPGENRLLLACAYRNAMELEDCYLLGDFGVSVDRAIVAEPRTLRFGDWTLQGYPHYAGSMIYHGQVRCEPGERLTLYLGEASAVDVAVWVNGSLAGHIPWRSANGLDITPYLAPGVNNVDIEVVGSPRNMLGPLHLAAGHEPWTDWRSFRRTDETYTPEYVLQPWGLFGQVKVKRERR